MKINSLIQNLYIPTDSIEREKIIDIWTENALMEHASIASFSRISLELMGLGAPATLIEGCYHAGLDEIRHAQIAFSMASYYLGQPIAPGIIPGILGSKIPKSTLKKFAFESFIYGYIGEGVSALILRESAIESEEKELKDIYTAIAEDEEKHSEFGWNMFVWCAQEEKSRGEQSIQMLFATLPEVYNFTQKYFITKNNITSKNNNLSKYGVISYEREIEIRDEFYRFALGKAAGFIGTL